MKKLNYILTVVVIIATSLTSWSQNTGIAPDIGSLHNYEVVNHSGSSYAWSVTTDFQGLVPVTYGGSGIATLSATTGNSIDITWNGAVSGTTYFVHVVETGSNGCSNRKVLAVTPASRFTMDIASVNSTGTVITTADTLQCAPSVTVTGYNTSDRTFTYDYGSNTFYFKISAAGIGSNGWSPQFKIDVTDSAASYDAEWSTSIGGTYTNVDLATNGSANDIDVTGGNANVFVKLVVSNKEGLANNPITVTLLDGANESEDANGNDVTGIGAGSKVQSVKARPSTSGIVTDL